MMLVPVVLALLQAAPTDSLHIRAGTAPRAALVAIAQRAPGDVREAIARAFARIENGAFPSEISRAAALRLAEAHAIAWRDSFHIREVRRFVEASPQWRRARVRADSLRRAGVAAYGRDGAASAQRLWRESERIAAAIADTTAWAAVLHNIGAAFDRDGNVDSARAYYTRARRLAGLVGDALVEANAVGALAALHEFEGELQAARALYDRATELRARIGDVRGAAADHQNLGLMAWGLGQLDEARQHIERALALNRQADRHDVAATNIFNLAGIAHAAGDMNRAGELYAEALHLYRTHELPAEAADAVHGLGRVQISRGAYREALDPLRQAIATYAATGPVSHELAARRDLAAAFQAMGELQAAADELRRAEALADSVEVTGETRTRLVLSRADLAVMMNRFDEAEQLFGEAERLFRQHGDALGEADARQGQALLLLERERWTDARQVLSDAVLRFEALGNARAAAVTRMLLGSAMLGQRDIATARTQLSRAVAGFAALTDRVGEAAALGELARLEMMAGRPMHADSLYTVALARVRDLVAPGITWELRLGKALAARSRHALGEAADLLHAATEDVERASMRLRLPERRTAWRADKWEPYSQLALTERRRGRIAAAFAASERMRAREMFELLQLGPVEAASGSSELMAREQTLRRRISLLSSRLEPASLATLLRGPDPQPTAAPARETLAALQQEYADLLLELRERAAESAELVTAPRLEWRDVAARLPPRTAMIEYLVGDSGVIAFVLTRDTLAAFDLGTDARELARLIEFGRAMIDRGSAAPADDRWRAPMRRLYDHLVAPISDGGLLTDVSRLIVVPHAELHYLPFAGLVDREGRFLIERFSLSFAPSAAVWLAVSNRRPANAAMGVLALAPNPASLPASSSEVAAVDRLMPDTTVVLTGPAASEAAFRTAASRYRVLHLATNGVLNQHNPLFSYVDLAAGTGHDGRLEVHEIFGLRLNAQLVVLSACETALGAGAQADVPPGDDWIGLTRAFIHAGAADVAATLWPVEDRASALLMQRFYEGLSRDGSATESLARAQRQLLRDPATAHPFTWAGVVLVGSGR